MRCIKLGLDQHKGQMERKRDYEHLPGILATLEVARGGLSVRLRVCEFVERRDIRGD